MKHRAIRLPEETVKAVEAASQERGFESMSAFIRYAIDQELTDRQDGLTGAEERLAASIGQIRKDTD